MARIFIDPGHGGSDTGATANGLQEKDLCLDIALKLRDILVNEYNDVEVNMSREKDEEMGLSQRAQKANKWNADYFVSIHINAGGGSGFESYIHDSRPEKTAELQDAMHPAIIETIDVQDRGKKEANFAVVRETSMSAILTENLFIDHDEDSQKLSDPDFRQKIARGHANGLEEAFGLSPSNSDNSSDDSSKKKSFIQRFIQRIKSWFKS